MQNEDGSWKIPGRAIVFNQRSRKLGWFYEVIDSRALEGARMENAISCWNHNTSHILGTVRNQTTSYTITAEGLDYETLPPNNQTTNDIVISPILRRDVTGSSFMFHVPRKGEEWVEEEGGIYVRYVTKIDEVFEWGPVSMAAYLNSSSEVAKRSFDEFMQLKKRQEISYRSQFVKMQRQLLR